MWEKLGGFGAYTGAGGGGGRKERLCVCILNLNPPSFHLILIILPILAVRAGTAAATLEIFPLFNEMFRFLHLPLPPYLHLPAPPLAPPLKSSPVFPSLLPSLLHCLWAFFFVVISHLAWKGNKRPTY